MMSSVECPHFLGNSGVGQVTLFSINCPVGSSLAASLAIFVIGGLFILVSFCGVPIPG